MTVFDYPDTAETLLQSEVRFWRELIASCGADQSPASTERMQQALALAENRLRESQSPEPGRVAFLEVARAARDCSGGK